LHNKQKVAEEKVAAIGVFKFVNLGEKVDGFPDAWKPLSMQTIYSGDTSQ
jgi:hypothetical protein